MPDRRPRHGGRGPARAGVGRGESAEDRQRRWKFGQNFLIDPTVIAEVAEDVACGPEDWALEIGPGQGAITKRLAARCGRVTAIEIDPKWVEHLRAKSGLGNLEVIQADASRIDLAPLLEGRPKPFVVGNLPYNRAAPILFRFLPFLDRFREMQIMVQLEVAKRIAAAPHSRDFGFLSAWVQNRAEATLLRRIGPDAFRPRPKVWSATVRLAARNTPVTDDPAFKPFLERAFAQKRKVLANALRPAYAREAVLRALEALGAPPTSRAEDLSVEQLAAVLKSLGPSSLPAPRHARRAEDADPEADDPE